MFFKKSNKRNGRKKREKADNSAGQADRAGVVSLKAVEGKGFLQMRAGFEQKEVLFYFSVPIHER